VDATIEKLKKTGDKPFYCQLWLNDPHAPLKPSEEQLRSFLKNKPPFTPPAAVYGAAVQEMDRQIGRLLTALDELHLSRNTLVIFTSDNGPEDIEIANAAWSGVGSSGPLRGRKRSLYEGGVRVPLLARWPAAIPAGKVNTRSVISGADWLPTFCELAGASVPAEAQQTLRGQSIAAALRGDAAFRRQKPLYWEWRFRIFNHPWNRSPMLSIREGDLKLLMNPDRSRVELYDIPADPAEQNNLAAQRPAVVEELAAKVLAWQKTLPPGKYEPSEGRNDYPWPTEKR
jgi:N-acetylgalactosamine-6-sulfatase